MLALKRALLQRIPTGTVVLDEIDTGISGRVARTVGTVMQQISTSQQVICITHLAQIASLSDNFIRVTKSADNGSTTVTASAIEAHQAQMDVAQLISGTDVTDASLAGAQELMQRSVESSRRSRKGA
jgi:DNA repair protein RecN (Recombination protein N)